MHIIVYVSDYLGHDRDVGTVLAAITKTARPRNKSLMITGVLLYHNRSFLQVIEGPKSSLQALMKRIEADPRHMNIKRLIDQPIRKRSFAEWNMDSFNIGSTATLERDDLEKVSNAFRSNPLMKTDLLVQFYKNLF